MWGCSDKRIYFDLSGLYRLLSFGWLIGKPRYKATFNIASEICLVIFGILILTF